MISTRALFLPLVLPILLLNLGCSVDMNRDRPTDSAVVDGKIEHDTSEPDSHAPDAWKPDGSVPDIPSKDQLPPDQGGDLGIVLVQGGFSTGGPGSGGGTVLVEGGFELGETLCNATANVCVTGGIAP